MHCLWVHLLPLHCSCVCFPMGTKTDVSGFPKDHLVWFVSLHQDADVLLDKADSHVLLPFICRHLYIQFPASLRQRETLQVAHCSDAAGKLPTDFSRLGCCSVVYNVILFCTSLIVTSFPTHCSQIHSLPVCHCSPLCLLPTHLPKNPVSEMVRAM